MNLKHKFRLLVAVAALGMVAIAGFWLTGERERLLSGKEEQMRSLTELAYSEVAVQYSAAQAGKLTEQQAQANAREAVRTMRYAGNNYLFISDARAYIVMHPFKPELEGKDASELKDPKGMRLFAEFARVATQNGSGVVYYLWPRPGDSEPVRKVSYVLMFKPWGWVIGTGTYIDDVDRAWWSSAMKAGAITLLCLLVVLGVSLNISRSIFSRLGRLSERIRDVAQGEGDLTKRIEVEVRDEVGVVAEWFNRFMDSLHGTVSSVAANTVRVNAAAEQMAAAAGRNTEGTRQQNGQVSQVAAAMQQMAATVAEVSSNSGQAAGNARRAADIAREGGGMVNEVLARMSSIADSVRAAAERIDGLGQRSDQIGKIVAVIEDIASQTNLLALNAAIEAARAGEHGRGFAVVAGEVRNLAERTTSATKEIAETIRAVQEETATAVAQMDAGTKLVEQGVADTSKAGKALKEIIGAAEQVGDMVAQIATAANEQTSAVAEINQGVAHISEIAQQSEATAQESSATCRDLQGLAEDLERLVGRFKLESDSGEWRKAA